MQHSDFEQPTEGTKDNGPLGLSADPTVAQVVKALDEGDHEAAGNLLRDALERTPEDKQLLRLAARQRRQSERFARVYSLLKETHAAIDSDEFVRAVGAYREAANLSQGFDNLEQSTFDTGVEEAGELGERNWRIARTLLEDAGRLNPKLVVPDKCWAEVKAAEREETIANVLAETALAKPAELGRARERLHKTLTSYPDDSSLSNRLKSIEATIEDKRKWDERQKCLKKLTDLRDAMQREEDPAEAPKYIPQSEALAAAYSADPEFNSVLEDIKHQVTTCEKAATALKQDRIEDCLEECAWVLSRMRHHQLFLNLKQQAEERELSLADEYSNSVSRIKDLLAAGQLTEADALCTKASAQLPQFEDLKDLKKEIASRQANETHSQENVDSARRLVERGERHLRENQHRLAEQSFASALKQLPGDQKLAGHISGILTGHARSIVRDNPQGAEEVMQLAARVLPGTVVPADLAASIRHKREQSKDESARWSSLNKIGALNAQVESTKKREGLAAVRAEAEKGNYAASSHADVREAASALFGNIDEKNAALDAKAARKPTLYKLASIAATLVLGVGLAYWLGGNRPSAPAPVPAPAKVTETVGVAKPAEPVAAPEPTTGSLVIRSEVPGVQVAIGDKQYTVSNEPLKVELNADSYQVIGKRPGYKDFGPVTVAVGKAAETVLDVKLTPKPARLEIPGAGIGTKIKVDGVLLAKNAVRNGVTKQLEAGEHSIELSRSGFLSKMLTRTLAPGETVVLTNRDLQLESNDARTLAAANPPVMTPQPDELQWQSLDRNNPDSLRAFVGQYPNSVHSGEAKQQLDSMLAARAANAAAAIASAETERKARQAELLAAEEAAWKKVNRRDEASLESYLRDTPINGRYHNQAEVDLATIRLGRTSANETAAVLMVISRLANAWNAKDLDSILAIQRNLDKRVVKAELSHVKELDMQISPASPPQIDGAQAVVLCRRHASQTFSDGTRKQIPEVIVSYVLAKHDGNWTIEGTK